MCNVSMVFDQWHPYIPSTTVPFQTVPYSPLIPVDPSTVDPDALARLLAAFKQAYEAAKEFDELTGQPDCEDPEKALLLERVAELERRLDELQR